MSKIFVVHGASGNYHVERYWLAAYTDEAAAKQHVAEATKATPNTGAERVGFHYEEIDLRPAFNGLSAGDLTGD